MSVMRGTFLSSGTQVSALLSPRVRELNMLTCVCCGVYVCVLKRVYISHKFIESQNTSIFLWSLINRALVHLLRNTHSLSPHWIAAQLPAHHHGILSVHLSSTALHKRSSPCNPQSSLTHIISTKQPQLYMQRPGT